MLIVPIFTFIAYARTNQLRAELDALKARLKAFEGRVPRPATVEAPAPAPPVAPIPAPLAVPASEPTVSVPAAAPAPARPQLPPMPRKAPAPDLATNLGPKILVGFGALAVFAALAFF